MDDTRLIGFPEGCSCARRDHLRDNSRANTDTRRCNNWQISEMSSFPCSFMGNITYRIYCRIFLRRVCNKSCPNWRNWEAVNPYTTLRVQFNKCSFLKCLEIILDCMASCDGQGITGKAFLTYLIWSEPKDISQINIWLIQVPRDLVRGLTRNRTRNKVSISTGWVYNKLWTMNSRYREALRIIRTGVLYIVMGLYLCRS